MMPIPEVKNGLSLEINTKAKPSWLNMQINPKQARLTLGLNQTQMANAMGVHRGTWSKWERREQQISAAPSRLIQVFLWLHSKDMFKPFLKNSAA